MREQHTRTYRSILLHHMVEVYITFLTHPAKRISRALILEERTGGAQSLRSLANAGACPLCETHHLRSYLAGHLNKRIAIPQPFW